MHEVKVILVDDEQPALQRLSKLIQAHTDFQVAAVFTRPTEALSAAASLTPHAAFVDIEMPGMNGLELADRLTEICPNLEVVIVTAFSEYALQAFRANAIDYLVKPVAAEDMVNCAKKLSRRVAAAAASRPLPREAGGEGAWVVGFGGFEVFAPGAKTPVRFATAKCEELLAFLFIHRDTYISKWELCESIGLGREPDKAEQNLHTCVYRLRKTFSAYKLPFILESQKGNYRLTAVCRCDFWEPELQAAVPKLWSEEDVPALEAVVGQYRGPLFAGKTYGWCEPMGERLERRYRRFAKRLSALHFAAGREDRAIEVLQALTAAAPYDEEGYELLLRAYVGKGDRASFLQLYRKMEQLFRSELGLEPGPAVRSLYEQIEGGR